AAPTVAQTVTDTRIFTSDNDHREFRYVELPNQLRVLLISAPGTDKAAAALDVNVGSREDPTERQGLAHFLEHMLFLGTDKYPNADAYQNYISAHGGEHNAFTAFEHTNYFFDIDAAYLEPALDRFSRFFVAPLFSAEYVEREKHAVDAEFKANIREDQRRALDVMREVINPDNPLAKFSVGNLDTLADRPEHPVRDDLIKFYRENYSSNLMTLVVIGREPLDQLQTMVTSRFAAIPNHHRTIAPITAPLLRADAPQFVDIKPVQQQSVLSLAWPLPDQRSDYRGKSIDYIGNILGHEGAGSLLSVLKQRDWALGLSAGQGLDYDGGAQFNVSIELTPAGEKHSDDIIALVYQTIALIRDNGIQPWLYREQQTVAEQRFRFREIAEPVTAASQLAGNLQEYPAAEVIRGDYLMEQYEPQRIAQLLAQLTPQNMLAMLTAPDAKVDKTSAYYATPYRVQTVSPQRMQRWLKPMASADIHLPAPNIFIAEQLPLKPLASKSSDKPTLLPTQPGLNLWYMQDATFRIPKATITIEVQSPLASDTPRHAATTELLVRMLRENLNEFSYPASLAGLNYSISRAGRGVMLRIDGFDAKQNVLLERLLDALQKSTIDPAVFARVRDDYRRELSDSSKRPPYELLRSDIGDVLVHNFWSDAELLQHSNNISAADVHEFAQQLFARIHIDMLVYGNVVASDAQQLGGMVTERLLANAAPIAPPPVQIMQLDNHDYRRTLAAPHDDAALLWYRQAGDNSKTTRVALGVSAQMIGSDFYTRLRTEQQFGYIVAAFPMPVRDVPGIVFLAQSTKAGPAQLAAAYRDFLQRWSQRDEAELRKLFELHRATLAQRLSEAPKNFSEAGERLWLDIAGDYRDFDSREQLIAAVKALTFEQWLALFRRDVLTPDGHAVWLAVDGSFKHSGLQRGKSIGDLARFKSTQRFYRFD
ncbi:MAG TPA: insulinase family protein, partial [Spongiibacteraceae bacterium]|nr:insulinase family protein [Spongiibacteraceae bacterium]